MTRRPASLHGVRVGPVPPLPRYYQDATTSRRPSRRASFPSLGGTIPARFIRSLRAQARRPGAWDLISRCPSGDSGWRRLDLPRSRGTRLCLCPALRPRRDRTHQTISMRRCCPRCVHDEGSHDGSFGAQSHGLGTRCLRFAGWVAPSPRKTRFRLPGQALPGGVDNPQGSDERFQICVLHVIPLSRAFVAQGHNT